MTKKFGWLSIMMVAALIFLTACGSNDSGSGNNNGGGSDEKVDTGKKTELTYWSWGESDIPGFDKWIEDRVKAYESANSNITINVVKQNADTLTGAFQATAATNSGPDIASLWATIPVLSQVWNGYVAPLNDYVKEDEMKHWINTSENTYDGKVWGAPLYLIGIPLAYNKDMFKEAGLDPENPPKTWEEFLAACKALKEHGFTPIGMGNKDGYGGAWMFSNLGKQGLDSMDDLKKAIIGEADIKDEKYTGWLKLFEELAKNGYINDDVLSLDINNGWKLFPSKKAAMSWTTDGNFISWLKSMGGSEHIGAMKTPIFGTGKLADTHNATQSITVFITSWSKHKQEAADFITFLHTQESIESFYTTTASFPADNRFDTGVIKDPETQKLFKWDSEGTQVWAGNYLPPMVDQNADIAGGQMINSKTSSAEEVVQLWSKVLEQWRSQAPDELENFTKWSK